MSDPYRVAVVCWGNICRSPMAEHLIRDAVEHAGLGGRVEVDSFGTSTEELGNPMDRRAIAALRRHGVRDTGWAAHRARQIRSSDIGERDLVLAADHVHDRILRERVTGPEEAAKIALLRSFDPAARADGDLGMADPWYGDDADFDLTYEQIQRALPGILERIRSDLA